MAIWQFSYRVSNNAINNLLRFLKFFIKAIGVIFHNKQLENSSDLVPLNFKSLHKSLKCLESDADFICYTVCPKCDSVYEYDDCIVRRANRNNESKSCQHIPYPRHSHLSKRTPCGTMLLKKVKIKSGYKLKPYKTYPYMPLVKSLSRLLSKESFVLACEKWRSRVTLEQHLGDIYDGSVWKFYNSSAGKNFLASPYHYLLTMNVDWFEPFERGVYSVGVIYLTVQNLSREERYKPENIILVGIIPGPSEPKLSINSYLAPLVIELQEAWEKGFTLTTYNKSIVTVKLALTCVACDIPASRKVCGFLSHNASLGCNKCYKKFNVQFGEPTNYGGFDRENWIPRTTEKHRQDVSKIASEVTKSKIEAAQSKFGVRYSVLLELPYFNPVQFTVIDIMHNIFLGTGKHMYQVWNDNNLLCKADIAKVECRLKMFCVPTDCGRVPCNIASSYGGFTAEQWKNWITIYSPVVLKGLLPTEHLRCWLLFVQACHLLCHRIVKYPDIVTADLLLLNFCKCFEQLYPDSCTPNLHLHLHLKDCFMDYGPPHAFWLFAFERYNGILGSYSTNKKAIEEQLMRKFCQNQAVHELSLLCDDELYSLLPKSYSKKPTIVSSKDAIETYKLGEEKLDGTLMFASNALTIPLPPYKEKILDYTSLQYLKTIYHFLYPSWNLDVLPFYDCYGHVTLAGELIGSVSPGANSPSSSVIMASWPTDGTEICTMRVGCVQFFLKHTLSILDNEGRNIQSIQHIFAYVLWKKQHTQYDYFGKSAIVCENVNDATGPSNFIPVQRIAYRCAHLQMKIKLEDYEEKVFIACPLPIRHSV